MVTAWKLHTFDGPSQDSFLAVQEVRQIGLFVAKPLEDFPEMPAKKYSRARPVGAPSSAVKPRNCR